MQTKTEHDRQEQFKHTFGAVPEVVVRSPGRVNLIGDRTDYHEALALRLATYDSPEALYQECFIELDGYYRERLTRAPPPEFARFLELLFEAVSKSAAHAGARAVSAEQRS